MYKIKQIPEDFIVNEINNLSLDNKGQFSYFSLKKKNYNTLDAIKKICEKLRINEKNIGFAGNKDKNAVTEQIISIKNIDNKKTGKIEDLKINGMNLVYVGKGNKEISLGSHQGNEFFITIRNLSNKEIKKIKNLENKKIQMPNYFGQQRFSKNNHSIGKAIIKKDFGKAIGLILESNSSFNEEIKEHLRKHKNDFVGALKRVPLKLLKLYVHSYQSFIFNSTIEQYLVKSNNDNFKKNKKINNEKNNIKINNQKVPIIGFGTEIKDKKIKTIINKIIENEKINFRDFIINAIPELSQEGDSRDLFIENEGFKIIGSGNDDLNKGKNKVKINFYLQKGNYATVFVDYLFKN